ncbi:MAG: hypothetical protein ABSG81_05600 [Acidimicrobiales bacterium]|jgi:hypothetical protein
MDHDDLALGDALRLHFARNGFPPDGGMSEKWALVRVGPIPVGIPNVAARRRATPIHDLNHLVSGYGHDAMGEAENAAWELGGGCRDYVAAWVLNCSALGLGIFRSPQRLFAAFVRGRQTSNLYSVDIDAVVDLPLSTVRTTLGLDQPRHDATAVDAALFAALVGLVPVVGLVPFAVSVVTSPVWLARGVHRQRRQGATPG